MSVEAYDFEGVERKWQGRWRAAQTYRAPRDPAGPTYFVLVFPPYPNGSIHMGHVRNYTIGDAVARYKRLAGYAVLHPIGFDAFGLPNEMEAARRGGDPAEVTLRNIRVMRRQLRRLGYSYDWRNPIITMNPRYYRWNQWLFLSFFERDLAYRKAARVQWCPTCKTSLANEQTIDGRCWRCEQPIVARHQTQWFFRLRAYAEEIWRETQAGAFPSNIAAMLEEWLGRTPGAELSFPVAGSGATISTFTTKPELSWGATYVAVAADHPLVGRLTNGTGCVSAVSALRDVVHASPNPGELLDGVDTGLRARHPLTGALIPIWVAAYVDPEFGTGAVMGNPCHDRNDHAFGQRHGLPGKPVVEPRDGTWDFAARGPFLEDGVLTDAGAFAGLASLVARAPVVRDWEARGIGWATTVFSIRDWCVSRQRAWGTPIPIVYCATCGAVGADPLPVTLPKRIRDTGAGNPLRARPDFVACRCPTCAAPAERETDTMDTFIDTAWYYLRCTNPRYAGALCDPHAARRWAPADLYVGGIEIAVPIMLYGSFIAKGLREAGVVEYPRPCRAILPHDMVLKDGKKMSKSLGNTVDPEELVTQVGADTVRLFILSLAPPLKRIEWSDARLQGCHRFLQRVWNLVTRHAARRQAHRAGDGQPPTDAEQALLRAAHETIRTVTTDIERLQLNTCITALIKFVYRLEEAEAEGRREGCPLSARSVFHDAVATLLVLLAPFTPHLCEELAERIGTSAHLAAGQWPRADQRLLAGRTRQITVQVNATTVTRMNVPVGASRQEVLALAYAEEAVQACLEGGRARKEIVVEDKLVNLVT